jgi:hypothetical protein
LTKLSIFDKQVLIFDEEKPSLRTDEKIMGLFEQRTLGVERGFAWVGEVHFERR